MLAIPKTMALFSAGTYLVSLALPAYYIGCGGNFPGVFALIFGPIDLLALHLPWLANPLLLVSYRKLYKGALIQAIGYALAAFVTALLFILGENKVQIAGGSCASTYKALIGYYVWLASIAFQLIACSLAFKQSRHAMETQAVAKFDP